MKALFAASLLALLSACGGLSGEYGSTDMRGEWEPVMTFRGGDVEIDFMGSLMVGKYEVKDGKVYISNDKTGQTQAFRMDDKGCIDGGMVFGALCRKP